MYVTLTFRNHQLVSSDLLTEIYSYLKKKDLYERFGVKEYSIVDPETKEVLTYVLENGKYKLFAKETGKLKSSLLNREFTF